MTTAAILALQLVGSLTGIGTLLLGIGTIGGLFLNHKKADRIEVLVNGRTQLLEKTNALMEEALRENGIAIPVVPRDPTSKERIND